MTNETQQTAVDSIIEFMKNNQYFIGNDLYEFIKQAKGMEKEQREKLSASWAKSREQTREIAMHIGFAKGFMSGIDCYEDYYEELIGTQLDEEDFTRNYITDRFEETYGGGNK
jgi:hypothetical protein